MPTTRTARRRTSHRKGRKVAMRRRKSIRRSGRKYNVHKFCRWFADPDTIVLAKNTGGVAGLGRSFQFDEIKNYTEFTSLYDQYKITHIKAYVTWSPLKGFAENIWDNPPTSALAALDAGMLTPVLWHENDFDDDGTPTLAEFEQSSRAKRIRLSPYKQYTFNLKPSVLGMVYQTISTTGYSPKWKQRLDCANDDIPHYAMKFLVQYLNNANLDMGEVDIRYKAYFTCYDTR